MIRKFARTVNSAINSFSEISPLLMAKQNQLHLQYKIFAYELVRGSCSMFAKVVRGGLLLSYKLTFLATNLPQSK